MAERIRLMFLGAKHPHIFPRIQLAQGFSDRCEVVGAYDSDYRTLDYLDQNYQIPTFKTLQESLSVDFDIAVIEGYDYQNPDLIRAVIPRVKAILLEKPGAPNLNAMWDLVQYCSQFPVYVTVGYMLQYSPIFDYVHRIIQSGVLGPIVLARFHAATPVGGAAEIWQSLPEDEGGLVWTDGCHMVRAIIGLFGKPDTVSGMVKKCPPGKQVVADVFKPDILAGLGTETTLQIGTLVHEDVAGAVFNYPDRLAVFDITGWEAHGWVEEWRIELWGADATLEAGIMPPRYRLNVRRPHSEYAIGVHTYAGQGPASHENTLVPDDAYTREFLQLLDAVEKNSHDQTDLAKGLQTLEVLDAIYRASRQGCQVVL